MRPSLPRLFGNSIESGLEVSTNGKQLPTLAKPLAKGVAPNHALLLSNREGATWATSRMRVEDPKRSCPESEIINSDAAMPRATSESSSFTESGTGIKRPGRVVPKAGNVSPAQVRAREDDAEPVSQSIKTGTARPSLARLRANKEKSVCT